MILNRRQLAALLVAIGGGGQGRVLQGQQDQASEARDRLSRGATELRKVKLDPQVQPAFLFKA